MSAFSSLSFPRSVLQCAGSPTTDGPSNDAGHCDKRPFEHDCGEGAIDSRPSCWKALSSAPLGRMRLTGRGNE